MIAKTFRLPSLRLAAALAASIFALSHLSADTVAVGSPLPALSGLDQHEKPYAVEPGTKHVLVSFDMGPGKQANAYFEKEGASYLPDHKAVFIANIFGMPGVGRFFAIPKMQKYPHRILLADEKGLLDNLPEEKGKVTVLTLDPSGKIASISFWSPKDGDAPL